MTLIIARHGETASNRDGLVLGQSDSLLTPTGLVKLKQVAEMLANYEPRSIFSSILGRAAFTAAIYSEGLGVPLHFRTGLAELSCGIWEGRNRSAAAGDHGSLRNTWTERPAGGESFADAETRVNSVLAEIRQFPIESVVLIVGHSAVNRVLLKLWFELDPCNAIKVQFPHDMLYIIENNGTVRHRFAGGDEREGMFMS